MAKHECFHIKSLSMLKDELKRLKLNIPFQEDTSILFEKLVLKNKVVVPNRFVVHPMEGFDSDPNGTPGKLSFRRYGRYAAGGTGLIWFEATAVMHEARSNPNQLYINKDNVNVFKDLVAHMRKEAKKSYDKDIKPVIVIQLTHSGRYSKPEGKPRPIIAHHSPYLDPMHNLPKDYPLVTDEYLDNLQDIFVNAAKLAAMAGFDGVDIKHCHRYLFSELLASFTRKKSKYGETYENRTRMIREIPKRIMKEVPEVFVTSRMNVYDAIPYPYGFGVSKKDKFTPDLKEPNMLIKELKEIGFPILNHSIGNPYYEPHFGRPYDLPIAGGSPPDKHPLENVALFLNVTRQVQEANPDMPIIGAGYSWLRQFIPNVAAAVITKKWATLLGQGRNSFAYPDSPNDLKKNNCFDEHKVCVTCSGCTQIMRDGGNTGCVFRDSEVYGKKYRKGRKTAPDRLQQEAEKCQDCESAMCQNACPANIDVPGFIKAFAENDIKKSYKILTQKNKFPELCSYVCPVEVQCEGACIENIFTKNPVAIHEIQKIVSKKAREMGIAKISLGKSTGKAIAVIGAGPAGLACAARLLELGHKIDIYDTAGQAGGVPGDVIPAYRLTKNDTLAEISAILNEAEEKDRLENHFNTGISKEKPLDEFIKEYDSVFLSMGLGKAMGLPNTKQDIEGVIDAVSFLKRAKLDNDLSVPDTVYVLGGGNTAVDAAVTAKQHGAKDVYIIYRRSFQEMPAWPAQRDEALSEGVHFVIMTQPLDYVITKGKLSGLKVARTILGKEDDTGRRSPVIIKNSESIIPAELIIEALGQASLDGLESLVKGVKLDPKKRIIVDEKTMATNMKKVFAGGDIINGGATAVQAVADGIKAAESIDSIL